MRESDHSNFCDMIRLIRVARWAGWGSGALEGDIYSAVQRAFGAVTAISTLVILVGTGSRLHGVLSICTLCQRFNRAC